MYRNGCNLKTLDKEVTVINLLESSYRKPNDEELEEHFGKGLIGKARMKLYKRKCAV